MTNFKVDCKTIRTVWARIKLENYHNPASPQKSTNTGRKQLYNYDEEDETIKQFPRLQQRKAIQTLAAAVLPLGSSMSMFLFRMKGDKLLDVVLIMLANKCGLGLMNTNCSSLHVIALCSISTSLSTDNEYAMTQFISMKKVFHKQEASMQPI